MEQLAAASKLPIIRQKIADLKRAAETFRQDCRAPFDHFTKTFLSLDANIIRQAQAKGHHVTWELLPSLTEAEVRAAYANMLQEIEAAEREAALLNGDAQ
jgi:hypothetical protein